MRPETKRLLEALIDKDAKLQSMAQLLGDLAEYQDTARLLGRLDSGALDEYYTTDLRIITRQQWQTESDIEKAAISAQLEALEIYLDVDEMI